MKHVLFAVLPERGHIHPFLGAAEALARRGAHVSFWAPRDVRAILAPLGFSDVHAPPGAAPPAPEHRGAAFAELLADPARLRAWIRAMLVDSVEPTIAPLRAHLREARPDVVVIDPMAYAAAIGAHEEDLPWLGLSTSLNPCIRDDVESELVATLRSLDDARRALFRAHGMNARFRVSDVLAPRGTFVLSTPALVGDDLPDDGVPVHLVGSALPSQDPSGVPALEGLERPLVYVSFGSQAWHQPRHVAVVMEAARTLDATFVVSIGALAETVSRTAPPNVRCVSFAPQHALLRRADVILTHGGANSLHEALSNGVPLLVSPLCNDQHHDATLVAARGCGIAMDVAGAGPCAVAEALRRLLRADGAERRAAKSIAASYASAGGAERIADVVLACS